MNGAEHHKLDLRTREGRAMAASVSATNEGGIRASLSAAPAAEQIAPSAGASQEIVSPSGRRISRENRRGFGNQGQKLAYPERPGYHRHWFNDSPGRVQSALESGYTHVDDPATSKPVTRVVGVSPMGGPLNAYLLEIPQEWWDDDMAELEKINASKEKAIKDGVRAQNGSDQGQFYASAQGRELRIGRGPIRR